MRACALLAALVALPALSTPLNYSPQIQLPIQDKDVDLIEGGHFPHLPHHPHPHPPPRHEHETIYQVLTNDPKFSKVTKAINYIEDVVSLLNDSSARITFFAIPDEALRPHRKRIKDSDDCEDSLEPLQTSFIGEPQTLADNLLTLEEIELSSLDEPDKEKRKRAIKAIIRAVLAYHILPDPHDIISLGENNTFATNLTVDGALDSQPLRLRVSQSVIPPLTFINLFTKVTRPNIKTSNGIIHVVSHPLIPPPSVFEELYMVPHYFSTLTSALQRSGLTRALDLWYVHGKDSGKGRLKGTSTVTIYAPVNNAFDRLPKKLQLFLFSPFGRRALKKVLQYHIVPDVVLHSNYIRNATTKEKIKASKEDIFEGHWLGDLISPGAKSQNISPDLAKDVDLEGSRLAGVLQRSEPVFSHDFTLKTLLANHTLKAHIEQSKITYPFPGPHKPHRIETKLTIDEHPVLLPDLVASNGAIHVVNRILDPRKNHDGHHHHKHHHRHHDGEALSTGDDWSDWEEWLPAWAAEE
ncbi:FAS1 domain-containing protein [Crucibulum laeve]|uniref:FAS1 domain-containing protein n=1 Tax=Crucibulum laeve TaxID=68775 RepID=A0A5C3MD30_9AGAR|nr:FAS1 domain-containing protein [Crucibulum laeve]